MASRNPFRRENGLLSPQATGQTSLSTAAPSFQSQDPDPPPSISQEQSDREALLSEPDDLPPAYTPGPAAGEGETTLELGPNRPFQQAPPSISQMVTPQATGSRYSGLYPPPPRHPSLSRHSTGNISQDYDPMPPGGLSPTRSGYAPPSTPAPSRGYAPPTGLPPSGSAPAGSRYAPPSGQPPTSSARPTNSNPGTEDDGRPTTSPTQGHPLLRNNRVLVYPKGYTCWKCNNTGFKSFDPGHPCRKCWERYSKPFEGPIVYAPWSPSSRSANPSADTLQKPLPRFRSPAGNFASSPSFSRAPHSHYNPPAPYMGGSMLSRAATSVTHRPPPGALVLQPGDPRIGGRLCWRCDGDGTVSFLIFDEETCPVCNGAGRIFN